MAWAESRRCWRWSCSASPAGRLALPPPENAKLRITYITPTVSPGGTLTIKAAAPVGARCDAVLLPAKPRSSRSPRAHSRAAAEAGATAYLSARALADGRCSSAARRAASQPASSRSAPRRSRRPRSASSRAASRRELFGSADLPALRRAAPEHLDRQRRAQPRRHGDVRRHPGPLAHKRRDRPDGDPSRADLLRELPDNLERHPLGRLGAGEREGRQERPEEGAATRRVGAEPDPGRVRHADAHRQHHQPVRAGDAAGRDDLRRLLRREREHRRRRLGRQPEPRSSRARPSASTSPISREHRQRAGLGRSVRQRRALRRLRRP